jgi:hypothetical protein
VSTTVHARAADQFASSLQGTEDGRRKLAQYQQMIADPTYKDFTAAIGQPYHGWTVGQVAALGRVHSLLYSGRITAIRIDVGAEPSRDSARDTNRAKLQQLPEDFVTTVYDGLSHDGDGLLTWDPGIADDLPGGWAKNAPLEIGHTDASRTFIHLAEHGVIARWPYNAKDIWLLGFPSFTAWADWTTDTFTRLLDDGDTQP